MVTPLDEVLDLIEGVQELLSLLSSSTPAVTGRLLDTIGLPVSGTAVVARNRTGAPIARDTSRADGRFELAGTFPNAYDLVVDPSGKEVRLPQQAPQMPDLGDLRVRRPVALTGTVGDGGTNAPVDVRRVQDRLHYLGRLTDADVAAEAIDLSSPNPIPSTAIPRLVTAIYACTHAAMGTRQPLIQPNDATLAMLNADPPFPLTQLALNAPVGELQTNAAVVMNAPADVRRVQDRLFQCGLLNERDYLATRVNPTTAPNPVPLGQLTATVQAIRQFEADIVGGSLRAIVPTRVNAQLLNDPPWWGRLSLSLGGSVGQDGDNRPSDVRQVQERLHELGLLADGGYLQELIDLPQPDAPPTPIDVAAIPQTVAAISRFRESRLGVAAPAQGRVDLLDPAVVRLNTPAQINILGIGEDGAAQVHNRPIDVRAVQERLQLLGLLSNDNFLAERVNPAAVQRVASATIPHTLDAIGMYRTNLSVGQPGDNQPAPRNLLQSDKPTSLTLTGAVGPGQANARPNVRAVQDRLHGLRFLTAADYQHERVDPAGSGPVAETNLASTFAALSQLRQQVLRVPAATAGQAWTAHAIVRQDDDTHHLLNDPLFFGRRPLDLTSSVGSGGWNIPADVRAVQDRLHELKLLDTATYTTEAVDPQRVGPVGDGTLAGTLGAIRTLQEQFLGAAAPASGRIEAVHPTLAALNNPLGAIRTRIDLSGSVGWNGANAPADVRAVQRRLRDLRFLPAAGYEMEKQAIGAIEPVSSLVIPRTIAAIERWRYQTQGAPAHTPIEPLDASHRILERPSLPRPGLLAITAAVGAGQAQNNRADVRLVQARLHQLGLLETSHYLAERAVAAGMGTIAANLIPHTIEAIRHFQRTASGGTDRIIGPNGPTARVMNDPTFSTRAHTNPHTDYEYAGRALPATWNPNAAIHAEIVAIIAAIEAHEAGPSTGEVPAILRNGSQTPASFGKAQLVVATGLSTLGNNEVHAGFYLEPDHLPGLNRIAERTRTRYDAIFALVPAPGMADAALIQTIQNYTANHLMAFHQETGLGASDITNMFRTAQLRRQVRAHIDAQPGPENNRREAAANTVANLMAIPDVVLNATALGLSQNDVRRYVASAIDAEHRNGFITRALFFSNDGQFVKNALTDQSGLTIGRLLIHDTYNAVRNQPGGAALTAQQRAQITARAHNSGAGGIPGWVANPASAVNNYVNQVMAHWVQP